MFMTNVSISDSLGHLLFYSNGCNIADQNGHIIPNGTDLNPGSYHNTLCNEIGRGYTAGYPSAVILPLPSANSLLPIRPDIFNIRATWLPALPLPMLL